MMRSSSIYRVAGGGWRVAGEGWRVAGGVFFSLIQKLYFFSNANKIPENVYNVSIINKSETVLLTQPEILKVR